MDYVALCFHDGDSLNAYRHTLHCLFGCFVTYVLQIKAYALLFGSCLISLPQLQISGGPFGPITFTALSTKSINIQIDRGSDLGLFQLFTIRRDNWDTACNIPIYATLTDCTDRHARKGNNHYRIGARYDTGAWVPDNYYADTLQHDRMHCLILV